MNDLKNMVMRNDNAAQNARDELKKARKTVEELTARNTTLSSQVRNRHAQKLNATSISFH